MNKKFGFLLAIFVIVLASGCSSIRKSPNFEMRSGEILSVVVVPTDASIRLVKFKGDDEVLYEESKEAGKLVQYSLENTFAEKGYDVIPYDQFHSRVQSNYAISSVLGRLSDQYRSTVVDAQNHFVGKLKWSDFNLSLGDDVNQLVDFFDADVLVFSVALGVTKTSGEMAKEVTKTILIAAASLGNVYYYSGSYDGQLVASVIDGDNGELLWHNFSVPNVRYDLREENDIQRMSKDTLRKYPDSELAMGAENTLSLPMDPTTRQGVNAILNSTIPLTSGESQLLKLGIYRKGIGSHQGAAMAFEKLNKERKKKDAWVWYFLAEARFKEGDLKAAKKAVKKAVKLDPNIMPAQNLSHDIDQELAKVPREEPRGKPSLNG